MLNCIFPYTMIIKDSAINTFYVYLIFERINKADLISIKRFIRYLVIWLHDYYDSENKFIHIISEQLVYIIKLRSNIILLNLINLFIAPFLIFESIFKLQFDFHFQEVKFPGAKAEKKFFTAPKIYYYLFKRSQTSWNNYFDSCYSYNIVCH